MKNDIRKIVLVGTGFVGMSFAYMLLNRTACDESVLIGIDTRRVEGEAMDLNHDAVFSGSRIKIYVGTYSDCKGVDIVTICVGVARKPEEARIDLLRRNTAVFRSVIGLVMDSGPGGILLIATNPVNIMICVTQRLSGSDPCRMIGSGTTLDDTRLYYLFGSYLRTDPRNVYVYIMGEHGDSEFVPWSQATVSTKPVLETVEEPPEKSSSDSLQNVSEEVKDVVQKTTVAKKSIYYGIGISTVQIARVIFGDGNSILTVSALLNGEYGGNDMHIGVPCLVSQGGVAGILGILPTEKELEKFRLSSGILKDVFGGIHFEE